MAKHRYKARVVVEGGTEETQFEPLDKDSPRVPSRYRVDAKEFGKFKDGNSYKLDPERMEEEAEEEIAEVQKEQAAEEAASLKEGLKAETRARGRRAEK